MVAPQCPTTPHYRIGLTEESADRPTAFARWRSPDVLTDHSPLEEYPAGASAQVLSLEPYLDGVRTREQRVLASKPRALDCLGGV